MKKINKNSGAIIAIFMIILIGLAVTFNNFRNLDVYSQETNGDIISKSGVVYQFNGELTSSYSGGKLNADKVIGRFEGNNFFTTLFLGPKVIKLKDYDGQNAFLVRGLMLQVVYMKK